MTRLTKTLAAGFGALALASAMTITFSTDAEAQYRRRGAWRGGGNTGAAVAAGVIGALAVGAIAASAAQPRVVGSCYNVRRQMWSERHGAYVVRRVRVCD